MVSTPMGVQGMDVQLSDKARKSCPYYIECKAQEKVSVWAAYKQAVQGSCDTGMEPIVIIKRKGEKPLAVVDADHFFMLLGMLDNERY